MHEIKSSDVSINELASKVPENFRNIQPESGMTVAEARSFWDTELKNSDNQESSDTAEFGGKYKSYEDRLNARIQQIVTLLYMHKEIVSSSGVHTKEAKGLHEVMDRAYKNKDYYKNNPMLKSTFDFLKMVVDSWFDHE